MTRPFLQVSYSTPESGPLSAAGCSLTLMVVIAVLVALGLVGSDLLDLAQRPASKR